MRNLLAALYERTANAPAHPALLFVKKDEYRQFAYADLLHETERWASLYATLRLRAGAVVAIVLDHRYELYPAFLGAMRAGLIPTFLPYPTPKQDPELYWRAQRELFARVRPACVLSLPSLLPCLRELTAPFACAVLDVDADQPPETSDALPPLGTVESDERIALLQHSSGTTGAKKGVALTFSAIREQNAAHARALGSRPDDRTVSWLPLYHDMGLIAAFLFPLTVGSTIVSLDAFEWLLRPGLLFELIERYRATHVWLPNFAFNHLVRTNDAARTYDLSSMRAFVSCSEPCKPATFEAFSAAFEASGVEPTMLRTCYAMAETVFAVTLGGEGPPHTLAVDAEAMRTRDAVTAPLPFGEAVEFLSCGKPLGGIELRIAAASGANVGEIQLRGRFVFSHYHENPSATAEAFEDGWYRTGDLGFVYEGELYVCGRRKEMLIVHGQNFYANDVEDVVGEVVGVKPGRVAVFAVYDDAVGSEEAVVLAESVADGEEARLELTRRIRAEVYSKLGLQVRTVEIRPIGDLVKTTSGKMSRDENARRYTAALTAAV